MKINLLDTLSKFGDVYDMNFTLFRNLSVSDNTHTSQAYVSFGDDFMFNKSNNTMFENFLVTSLNKNKSDIMVLFDRIFYNVKNMVIYSLSKKNSEPNISDKYELGFNVVINTSENKLYVDLQVFYISSDKHVKRTEMEIPKELRNVNLPRSFTITYSGVGDSGGVDDITYATHAHPLFQNWVSDTAEHLIPSDASFDNEGSRGEILGVIVNGKKISLESIHHQHKESYFSYSTSFEMKCLGEIEIEV